MPEVQSGGVASLLRQMVGHFNDGATTRESMMVENEEKALQSTGEKSLTFGDKGLQLTNFDDMWRFANMVKRSGMCPPDRSPESIMISLQKGSELGFPLLESIHLIPTVKGRPTMEGKGMLALIQARKVDDPRGPIDCGCTGTGEDRVGWCESWRKGWPKPRRTEFTWHQAVTAGLTKPRGANKSPSIYTLYGEDMVQWKAVARHSNKYYGDIMHGLMDTMTATEVYADVKDVTPQTLDELPLTAGEPDPLLVIEGASEPSDADVVEAGTGDSRTSEVRKMEPPEKCLAVENGEGCLRKFGHEGAHLCGHMNTPFERGVKALEGERPVFNDNPVKALDLEPAPTEAAEMLDATQAMAERMTGQGAQDPNEEPICGNHLDESTICQAPEGHPWDCVTGEVFEEESKRVVGIDYSQDGDVNVALAMSMDGDTVTLEGQVCGKGPSTKPCMQAPGHDGKCDWKLGREDETPSMI